MANTILLAGKEMPAAKDFAESAALSSRTVLVTAPFTGNAGKQTVSDSVVSYEWNKISPVASHSLVLQCENGYSRIDEAVLYFDETACAAAFPEFGIQSCSEIINNAVIGYQYLAVELLARFEQKKTAGTPCPLVFIHKTDIHNPSYIQMNPAVRAAGAGFAALAEGVAAHYGNRDSVNVIMVHADVSGESSQTDAALASWLCSYLDAVSGLKTKLTARQSLVWVKPGTKGPAGWFNR